MRLIMQFLHAEKSVGSCWQKSCRWRVFMLKLLLSSCTLVYAQFTFHPVVPSQKSRRVLLNMLSVTSFCYIKILISTMTMNKHMILFYGMVSHITILLTAPFCIWLLSCIVSTRVRVMFHFISMWQTASYII